MAEPVHSPPLDYKEKDTSSDGAHDVESYDEVPSPAMERRIMRRVDMRILPLLGLIYALALIDRTNLGIARAVGMGKDLKLTVGDRYSLVSAIYFPPYILLELPSNLVLRKFGPRLWLSFIVLAWGAVQIGMGFVPNWQWLAVCRVLLGIGEAGFFPAIVFIVSTWYTRFEVQKRLAGFFLGALFISGFSSIMAYAFSLLAKKQGIAGWSWIFIIEGTITMALGVLAFIFIADFPDKNTFLSRAQTKFVLKRIEDDRGDSIPDPITLQTVMKHLKDWKIWVFGLMFMCQTMPAYFIGFFITLILQGMGWNVRDSLLLTAPPYAYAFVQAFFFAWLSDKTRKRAIWLVVQTLCTTTGLFITAFAKPGGARYFGLFLVNAGASGCIPGVLAYSANNVVSHSQRAVSTAIIIAFGGVGGIFATMVFRQKDYPHYIPGLWATIGAQFFFIACLALMTFHFRTMNKKLRDGKLSEPLEGRVGFYYTL